jgi:Tol biopolymer transport system component
MGRVWKARDTRLDRIVAIKVAQEKFSERFEREARAVAALNHPHICTLYDVGPDYLVMEYIEGKPPEGQLPLDQALKYASQICDALDAAHKKHIVHRDLKPGNILITKSGVKLLDFGLAQISSGVDAVTSPVTQEGMVMGTLQYMSPEQLEGKKADARSDIYSLGLVLYEMVTGKRAFPPAHLESFQPPALERVIKTCLVKDPDARWQSAHDVSVGLELSSENRTGPSGTAVNKRLWQERAVWLIAVTTLLLAVAVLASAWRGHTPASGDVVRFPVYPPENGVFNGVLNTTVTGPQFALSPDGRSLVFAAAVAGGRPRLWVRTLEEVRARALPGTDEGEYPFWSPDSEWVGFFAEGKLKRIPIAGGPVQLITDAVDPRGGSWAPDGTILFGNGTQGIFRVPPGGRSATRLTDLDLSAKEGSHRYPSFLPGSSHFLFTIRGQNRRGIYAGSLDGMVKKLLIPSDSNSIYVSPGFLLFWDAGVLWAQAFDAKRLELRGEPFTVSENVGRASNGYASFSASREGTLAYASSNQQVGQLSWFDRGGKQLDTVGPPGDYTDLRLSPDGKRLAATLVDTRTGNPDIWLTDLEHGGSPFRLTSGPALNSTPAWAPDGSHIVFRTTRNGGQVELYEKSTGGAGNEQPVLEADAQFTAGLGTFNGGQPDWSPDGASILYSSVTSSGFQLWLLSLADRKLVMQLSLPSAGMHANFSLPDGKLVAYASNESGTGLEVYVQTLPLSDRKWKVSSMGGYEPRWRADGREIYYLSEDRRLMAVSIGPGPSFGVPESLFRTNIPAGINAFRTHYVSSIDGKRFLINTQTGDPLPIPITVVLNWTAGLKK